ncbi:tandem-95 repeat protein, partial [uncultured Shewanella sp.]|uniref:tandem-95 repeat protein n=1 Tax=uncultured Shewanella sp. TaxID=173975 RepID=UPI00261E7770
TPEADFNGDIALSFDVSDGIEVVASGVDLAVNPVNDLPTAEDVAFSMDEDGTILITSENLLLQTDDIDGDDLSILAVKYDGTDGILVPEVGTDNYLFTPNENFNGDIGLTYEVSDGITTTSANIDIHVVPVNDAPIIEGPLSYSINEDGHIHLSQDQLLVHASDIEGDALTAVNLSVGEDGVVTEMEDGGYLIVPNLHFSGELPLTFDVSDGVAMAPQVVNIHVEAVADAPDLEVTDAEGNTVGDSTIIIDPDDALELNIGAALVDQDLSETLTVTLDGLPEGSVVNVDGESLLQSQENGLQSFEETEVTITFEGEGAGYHNSVGVYKVDENGNIKDVEIVFENASAQGSGGTLLAGESSFSFDINEGEHFNLFTVPNGESSVSKVDPNEGQFVFRDDDGSPATMDSISPQLIFIANNGEETVITGAAGDSVYHGGNSSNLNADGIVHTRTELNDDNEIIYGFEDIYGGGDKDFDDFTFSIDMGTVNNQVYGGEIEVDESGSIQIPTTAINETIQIHLPQDYSDEFDVTVRATATELSNDDTSSVFQTVHVDAREHAPESADQTATIDEDGSYIFTLDDFPFSDQNLADTLESITVQDLPIEGVIFLSGEPIVEGQAISRTDIEEGLLQYDTESNFNGEVSLNYTVSDGEFSSAPQNFTIEVNPVNDGPVAVDDGVGDGGLQGTLQLDGDDYLTINAGAGDSGEQITAFWFKSDTDGSQGLFSVTNGGANDRNIWVDDNGDVHARVWPAEEILVSDVGDLSDGEWHHVVYSLGGSEGSALYIDGEVVDTGSVGSSGFDWSAQMHIGRHDAYLGCSSLEGEIRDVQVYVDTGADQADVNALMAGDELDHSPLVHMDFSADNVFDSGGAQDIAISVIGNPTVVDQVTGDLVASEDVVTNFDVLANDSDVEDEELTISSVSDAVDAEGNVVGSVTIINTDSGEQVQFMPSAELQSLGDDELLSVSFTYTIEDSEGAQDSAVVNFNVQGNNDVTVVEDVGYVIEEDGSLTFTDAQLLSGATDIDGDDLSVAEVSYTGTAGVFTDNGDGTYTFAPNDNFNG